MLVFYKLNSSNNRKAGSLVKSNVARRYAQRGKKRFRFFSQV